MSDIREAFEEALRDATLVQDWHCTLYLTERWYGGAEEGGWWGSTVSAVAHVTYKTEAEAEAALAAVKQLAIAKTKEAKQIHGDVCLQQLDYCEQRGIDDANSVFGEVDGEDSYSVRIENELGASEYSMSRYYE
jgi:hypothetical protein